MPSAFAPGRLELIGNHTDYNGGYAIAFAVNMGVTAEGEAREDDVVVCRSFLDLRHHSLSDVDVLDKFQFHRAEAELLDLPDACRSAGAARGDGDACGSEEEFFHETENAQVLFMLFQRVYFWAR